MYQSQPKDLQAAVMTAVGAEAYLRTDANCQQKVRAADTSVAEYLMTNSDRLDKLAAAVEQLAKRPETGGPKRKWTGGTTCFSCGQEGHFKRERPQLAAKGTPAAAERSQVKWFWLWKTRDDLYRGPGTGRRWRGTERLRAREEGTRWRGIDCGWGAGRQPDPVAGGYGRISEHCFFRVVADKGGSAGAKGHKGENLFGGQETDDISSIVCIGLNGSNSTRFGSLDRQPLTGQHLVT